MAQSDVLGIIFALVSSVSFAASSSVLSRPLVKANPSIATHTSLFVGVVISGLAAVLFGQASSILSLSIYASIIFILIGVFHFNISRQLVYTAVKHIGSNQTAPIQSTQVIYSIIIAVVFLGEKINTQVIVGTTLILFGVSILRPSSGSNLRGGNPRIGYTNSLLAGLIRGFTPVLISLGIALFPFFIAATFISYSVALLTYSFFDNPVRYFSDLKKVPHGALKSYILSGSLLITAHLLNFGALSYAPVVVVVPITAIQPMLVVIITFLVAREIEAFRARTLLSILFTIIGTILATLPAI